MAGTEEKSYGIVGESHNYMGTPRRTGEVIDITGWSFTGEVWALPVDPEFLREQSRKLNEVADAYESREQDARDREKEAARKAAEREERKAAELSAAIAEESAREAAEASRLSSVYKGDPVAPTPTFSDQSQVDEKVAEESVEEVKEAPVTGQDPTEQSAPEVQTEAKEPRDGDGDGKVNDGTPRERPSNKELGSMTNAALKTWLDEHNVEVKSGANKGELIKAIKDSTRA